MTTTRETRPHEVSSAKAFACLPAGALSNSSGEHSESEHADLLFSSPKNRCHYTRATVFMEHGNRPGRALARGVGDQVIPHPLKAQRAYSEVLAAVSGPSRCHATAVVTLVSAHS